MPFREKQSVPRLSVMPQDMVSDSTTLGASHLRNTL